jgi:hypothetical protein
MTYRFGKPWSKEEDAVLLAHSHLTGAAISLLLPGRTDQACVCRRRLLRTTGPNGRPPAPPPTEAEDEVLRANFGRPLSSYKHLLNKRSEYWIMTRRAELGLRRPQYQPAPKAAPVESLGKQLQPEGTAYRTRSGMPARIINRFPMPDVPSVYGP